MLIQSLLLIATMLIVGSALLTSTLVSAKAAFHRAVIHKSETAMSDATAQFVSWAQNYVSKYGTEAPWPTGMQPQSGPISEDLCTGKVLSGEHGISAGRIGEWHVRPDGDHGMDRHGLKRHNGLTRRRSNRHEQRAKSFRQPRRAAHLRNPHRHHHERVRQDCLCKSLPRSDGSRLRCLTLRRSDRLTGRLSRGRRDSRFRRRYRRSKTARPRYLSGNDAYGNRSMAIYRHADHHYH